jgi:hypothetical protein
VEAQRYISHAIAMAKDPSQALNTGGGMTRGDKGLLSVFNLDDLSQQAFGNKRRVIM